MLRRSLAETPSFENQAVDRPVSTAKLLWKEHRRESILVGMLSAGGGLGAYTYITYMQKFLFNSVGFDKETATWIIAAALLWFAAMQPVFGALADRFGRKPMLLLFGIGGAIVAAPTFFALETVTSPVTATLLILVPLTLQSGYTANNALVKAELFPAHIRGLGVALPYAIGNAIFAWLWWAPPSNFVIYLSAGVDQFAHGLQGTVFVVYLSMLVNPRYPVAQYAFLSGFAFLIPRLVAGASGAMQKQIGYDGFFLLAGGLSAAAVLLLPLMANARPRSDDA